jgi:tetratricopeptide (TPR) repeat protein
MVREVQRLLAGGGAPLWLRARLTDIAMANLDRIADPQQDWDVPADRSTAAAVLQAGRIRMLAGKPDKAKAAFDKALGILGAYHRAEPYDFRVMQDLCAAHADAAKTCRQLGLMDEALGHLASAATMAGRLRKFLPASDPWMARNDWALLIAAGDVQRARNEPRRAMDNYRQALKLAEASATSRPGGIERRDISLSLKRVAGACLDVGELDSAGQLYRQSLRDDQRLAEADPDNAVCQRDLAADMLRLGEVAFRLGRLDEAGQHARQAMEKIDRLRSREPDRPGYSLDAARALLLLGRLARAAGDDRLAEEHLGAAETAAAAASPDPAGDQAEPVSLLVQIRRARGSHGTSRPTAGSLPAQRSP